MKDAYLIEGNTPLKGEVRLSGAKNVAVKAIIAALLFEGEVILKNIPHIQDVYELMKHFRDLGAKAEFYEENTVKIDGTGLKVNKSDLQLHDTGNRSSFMLFAPLLYKFKSAYIPNPSISKIGARPIDRVVQGMEELGVEVDYDEGTGFYKAEMKSLPKGSYTFNKPSHTGTEMLILLSVLSDNEVRIENAGLEPEIDDLIRFLNESGARISRNGTTIYIKGVKELHQQKPYTISWDRNEAVLYAVLAVITKGDIIISRIEESVIRAFNDALQRAGGGVEHLSDGRWRYFYKGPLKAVDITTSPHPGFMTDWQPVWAVLMTQAQGKSIIQERVHENRFNYVDELRKMGADIEFIKTPINNPAEYFFFNFDPSKKYNQTIRINGPKELLSSTVEITDIRTGIALITAAFAAEGKSTLNAASVLEKGYEKIVDKTVALGGIIARV
jgi:UDP-N-acetylglucosamine 1-carboxyvinyltransferase